MRNLMTLNKFMNLFGINSPISRSGNFSSAELETAIEKNSLCLNYFPVIDVASRKIQEVEALLRWHVTKDKYISPLEFIPVAIANGLMSRLSRWVIKSVIEQLVEWSRVGIDIDFSINLSKNDLNDMQLVDFIVEEITNSQVDVARIGFEIPEGSLIDASQQSKEWLLRLQSSGVRLVLDNVTDTQGKLPFDQIIQWNSIKIERHLVMKMVQDKRIAKDVCQLIKNNLNDDVVTVAPGVHSYQEWDCIKDTDCHHAQGFYFSPPQSSTELEIWFRLTNWRPDMIMTNPENTSVEYSSRHR